MNLTLSIEMKTMSVVKLSVIFNVDTFEVIIEGQRERRLLLPYV